MLQQPCAWDYAKKHIELMSLNFLKWIYENRGNVSRSGIVIKYYTIEEPKFQWPRKRGLEACHCVNQTHVLFFSFSMLRKKEIHEIEVCTSLESQQKNRRHRCVCYIYVVSSKKQSLGNLQIFPVFFCR